MLVFGKKQKAIKINSLNGIIFNQEDYDFTNECMSFLENKNIDINNVNNVEFIREGKLFKTEKDLIKFLRNEFSIQEWEQSDKELLIPFKEDKDIDGWMYEEYINEFRDLYNIKIISKE